MNTHLKLGFGLLTLALTMTGCSNIPFWQSSPPPSKTPTAKAPVTDRNARRPPGYPAQPPSSASQADTGSLPQDDPLLPREYSSAYPPASDPYAKPTRPYPPQDTDNGNVYRQPTYPRASNTTQPPTAPYPGNTTQSPTYPRAANTTQPPSTPYAGSVTQAPAYPPGAAASRPAVPPADGYGRTAPPSAPAYPASPPTASQSAETRRNAAPAPGALPEPQPVVPKTPPVAARPPAARPPVSDNTAVATAPPAPAVEQPPTPAQPPAPPRPPTPPADLPPAEITREGNQAVAALLESADKNVKSNQLDKAGAALERALRIEPRNAGIWHDLAQIRLHQGQYQQAESLASKSSNLASSNRALQARNWKVIAAARKAAGNASGAEEAEARAAQFAH